MGRIRPLTSQDIPEVAALHWRVFSEGPEASAQLPPELIAEYEAYFRETFLEHPWYDDEVCSQVYEEGSGQITGLLGVVPVRMSMNGKHIRAAIGSQFIVDPAWRSTLAGVRLMKTFLNGPQDLSIADEANEQGRKLWEGLGGRTSLLYSIHWTRPLRPGQLALTLLNGRKALAPFARLTRPLVRLADLLVTRIPQSQLYLATPSTIGEDLAEGSLTSYLSKFAGEGSLHPEYDHQWLKWAQRRASRLKGYGAFRGVLVRHEDGAIAGWYLYHLNRGGICNVLQIAGTPQSIHVVLNHLIQSAGREGVIALAGRLEPRYMQALSEKHCLFHRRGPWVLVHSKQPELLQAISEGNSFLSRLEGEWCLKFH